MNAREIFLRAIEFGDVEERRAFVVQACSGDTQLQRRVEALITADDDPDSYLDRPAAKFAVTETQDSPGSRSNLSDSSSHHGRFLPGTKIADRYRIVSLLGRGGMGEVYRADDLRLGQTVALKFLPANLAKDSQRLEYFRNEVRLARQISHPNICRVYDIGEIEGEHFISMEYIDGEDLNSLLRRIGRLPQDKGTQIAQQLCAGLAAAHAVGVLHRDRKPANIMIDGRGRARITDFGLAMVTTDGAVVAGMSGTPAYLAPEQMLRGETSAQSDIYSLGLILFEVFTGKPANDAGSLAELRTLHENSSAPMDPSEIFDDIDPAISMSIRRCISPSVDDRPTSVLELSSGLLGGDPLRAALAAGETPSPELVAASGSAGGLSARVAGLFVIAVFLGLVCVYYFADRALVVNRVGLARSPDLMEDDARELLSRLGYDDRLRHHARGLSGLGWLDIRDGEQPSF